MVLPLIVAGASFVPTAMAIGSKVGKFMMKKPLGQAVQFGIGYGASTNIGYNLANQTTSGLRQTKSSNRTKTYELSMPYNRYGRFYRSSRYSRYGRRSRYRRRYYGRRYY